MKMLRYIIFGVLVVIFLLTGTACASAGGNTPSPSASAAPSSSASQSTNAVVMKGFAFTPSEITIKKGETVVWTNEDSATHDVAGDSFKSDKMKKGDTFSFTFSDAGTFDYVCTLHAGMKGTVIVE